MKCLKPDGLLLFTIKDYDWYSNQGRHYKERLEEKVEDKKLLMVDRKNISYREVISPLKSNKD